MPFDRTGDADGGYFRRACEWTVEQAFASYEGFSIGSARATSRPASTSVIKELALSDLRLRSPSQGKGNNPVTN